MSDDKINEQAQSKDIVMFFASVFIIFYLMKLAAPLLIPILLSIFITIVLEVPVATLKGKGFPGWLAVLTVVTVTAVFSFVIAFIVGLSVDAIYQDFPLYKTQFLALLDEVHTFMDARGIQISQFGFVDSIDSDKAMQIANSFVGDVSVFFSRVGLVILTTVFMLADTSLLSAKISAHRKLDRPGKEQVNHWLDFFQSLGVYLKIMFRVSLLTGLMVWLGLFLLGVKYSVMWGLIAFLCNFIPTVGSIVAAIPVLLLSILTLDPVLFLMILGLYLFVNIFIGNVIQPIWMGKTLGLSTLAVFLSLIFWGWLFGIVGMLISVPLTMLVHFLSLRNPHTLWLAVLLSNEVPEYEEIHSSG